MSDNPFKTGASVLSSDGNALGTVQGVAGADVLVEEHDGRVVYLPHSKIDLHRSTPNQLVLLAPVPAMEDVTGITIPRHSEDLSVHVTEVEQGKVRIHKSVESVPVHQDVELGIDVVEVERVPSGEEYDEMPESWQEGDTLVIPVVEEVVVLTRRYRVVENVRVTRHREIRTERVQADLRRENVTFSEEDADGNPIEP